MGLNADLLTANYASGGLFTTVESVFGVSKFENYITFVFRTIHIHNIDTVYVIDLPDLSVLVC